MTRLVFVPAAVLVALFMAWVPLASVPVQASRKVVPQPVPVAQAAEIVSKRTLTSETRDLGGGKYALDATIGNIHYYDAQGALQPIDNVFEPAAAPWHWQMTHAGYAVKLLNSFSFGRILEFSTQGEVLTLQPMNLEWTNDLNQIQPVSNPQAVNAVVTNPTSSLIADKTNRNGTATWAGAYGVGTTFQWVCGTTRLAKTIKVNSLASLPTPSSTIVNGGHPVLRWNLIFDASTNVGIYVDNALWDRRTKVTTFNTIEFRKTGQVLWGFMPLMYWDSAMSENQSVATLERRGSSLYISIRVPHSWLQTATYPVFIDTNVDVQVGASTDDCHRELTGTGYLLDTWSVTGSKIAAGAGTTGYAQFGGGMRFANITVSQGAIISSANLILKSYNAETGVTVRTRISAEDVDDAPTFANDKDIFDARWANRTTVRVDWDSIPAWAGVTDYTSPEIKTVIKEIVDRALWASGNDIVIFWEDFEDRSTHGSSAYREACSYDAYAPYAPKLHIEYSAGSPSVAWVPRIEIW